MTGVPPRSGDSRTSLLLAGHLDHPSALLDPPVDTAAVSTAVTAGGETSTDVVNVSYQ